MSTRRTLILVAAIVIGAVAAFALYQYVDGVEDRAYEDARRVKVFVVKKDVGKGFSGDQAINEEFIEEDEIPQEFRPATALTDLEVVRGKVALSNLSAGQVVVDGMFVDPRTAFVSFSERIEPGRVAITISVDQVRGVAGLLVPGDRVNMIVDTPEGRQFMYQNVEILAIGGTAAPDVGATQAAANPGSGLITFSVPPEAALRITGPGASAYLALVPPDNVPVAVPAVPPEAIIPSTLTPYPDEEL